MNLGLCDQGLEGTSELIDFLLGLGRKATYLPLQVIEQWAECGVCQVCRSGGAPEACRLGRLGGSHGASKACASR